MSTGIADAKHTGTTCVVCCKLPNGLILESGYSIENGNVVRLATYKRVVLAGANAAIMRLAAETQQVPVSPKNARAGITINVDEAFYDKWVKDHADSNIVRNKQIWKCKSLSEAQAMVMDDLERKSGWESREQIAKTERYDIQKLEREEG